MVGVQNLNFSLTNSTQNRKAMRRKLSVWARTGIKKFLYIIYKFAPAMIANA